MDFHDSTVREQRLFEHGYQLKRKEVAAEENQISIEFSYGSWTRTTRSKISAEIEECVV